jgi:hypothetical protein
VASIGVSSVLKELLDKHGAALEDMETKELRYSVITWRPDGLVKALHKDFCPLTTNSPSTSMLRDGVNQQEGGDEGETKGWTNCKPKQRGFNVRNLNNKPNKSCIENPKVRGSRIFT